MWHDFRQGDPQNQFFTLSDVYAFIDRVLVLALIPITNSSTGKHQELSKKVYLISLGTLILKWKVLQEKNKAQNSGGSSFKMPCLTTENSFAKIATKKVCFHSFNKLISAVGIWGLNCVDPDVMSPWVKRKSGKQRETNSSPTRTKHLALSNAEEEDTLNDCALPSPIEDSCGYECEEPGHITLADPNNTVSRLRNLLFTKREIERRSAAALLYKIDCTVCMINELLNSP